jgi:hypothetical protein
MGNQNRKAAQKNKRQLSKYMQQVSSKTQTQERICPYCGAKTVIKTLHDVLGNGDYSTKVYTCSNYPGCDSYVRLIGNLPVTLADKELRTLRQRAHYFMDKVLALNIMNSKEMYRDLRLFLNGKEPHLSVLRKEDCQAIAIRYRNLLTSHDLYKALTVEELEKLYEPTPKYYMFQIRYSGQDLTCYLKNSVTVRSGDELLNIIKNNLDDVLIPKEHGLNRQDVLTGIRLLDQLQQGTWKQVIRTEYEDITKIHESDEE